MDALLLNIFVSQVEFNRFLEVFHGILKAFALAGDVKLGTACNIPIVFLFHYRGKLLVNSHFNQINASNRHLNFFNAKTGRKLFFSVLARQ